MKQEATTVVAFDGEAVELTVKVYDGVNADIEPQILIRAAGAGGGDPVFIPFAQRQKFIDALMSVELPGGEK